MDHIKSEIKKAPFVSIALDATTDVANLSQLSTVVRYVLDGIPEGRFLGFLDVTSERTADALFKIVCEIISSLECGSKLVGQSYDGAAVMAGHLGGLQAKVKEKFKHAIFVHCIAHRPNLILLRNMDNIKDCKVLFSTLSCLASFFSMSSKRTGALDIHVQKRFPKVAPTRWNYNGRLVQTVFQFRDSLIHFFQDFCDNKKTWDTETVTAAKGSRKDNSNKEGIFVKKLWSQNRLNRRIIIMNAENDEISYKENKEIKRRKSRVDDEPEIYREPVRNCRVSQNEKYYDAILKNSFKPKMSLMIHGFNNVFGELKSEILEMTEKKKKIETFRETTNVATEKPSYSQIIGSKFMVVIKPVATNQSNTQNKSDIVKNIDPLHLNIQVSHVKQIKDGGILIGCKNQENANNFRNMTKQKLSSQYKISEAKKIETKIRIVGLMENYEVDDIVTHLKGQNDVFSEDNQLKVLKVWPTNNNPDVFQALILVDALTFGRIMDRDRLFVNYDSCNVFDATGIKVRLSVVVSIIVNLTA
ncbi:unnamed protein product [Psylliodes chrysocephalus]|uniref:DUF4371 domain-containing protein n=1 Tax=Psylliodes chrysocephalus TaxID=3402493 RepID=A0A9P0D5H1_9CUCU|nr:unnamed protein product [Psylliodes chrysocephala]